MNRYWVFALLLGCAADCRPANAQSALKCSAFSLFIPTVRAEGVAELVGDVLVQCTGGTPVSPGAPIPAVDMQLSFNANVASRIIGTDGQSSEALLLIDFPLPDGQFPCELPDGVCLGFGNGTGANYYGSDSASNRNVFQGVRATGSRLLWKGIPFDPPGDGENRFYTFTNLRLNATSVPIGPDGSAELNTTGINFSGAAGTFPVDVSVVPLATVKTSLAATVRDAEDAVAAPGGVTIWVDGAEAMALAATLHFGVEFPQADKPRTSSDFIDADHSPPPADQNDPLVNHTGTESGFYNSAFGSYGTRGDLATAGLADSGTRYMAVIDNIPAGYNVYVDVINVTSWDGSVARLTDADPSGAGSFVAAIGSDGVAQLTVNGGKAVAVWEVLNPSPYGAGQYDFGVYLSHPATNAPPASTNVQLMYAPTGGLDATPTKAIPVFAGTPTKQTLFKYSLKAHSTDPPPNPNPNPNPNPPLTPPTLLVSPASMSFSGTAGGQNPPPQFLQISSTLEQASYRISTGGKIHFQPFPAEGVTYHLQALSVDLTGMQAGTYQDVITVTNTISGGAVTVAVTLTLNATPQVSTLSVPAVEAGAPGFTLAVNGSNFTRVCAIFWNGSLLSTTYVSAGQLQAQVQPSLIASVGSAAITVATADGATSNRVSLAIEKFMVGSVSPSRATAGDAGFMLTIAGSGFFPGTTVNFGNTVLQPASVTHSQVMVPVAATLVAQAGAIQVSVSSVDGTVSNPFVFTVLPAFRIDRLSPAAVVVFSPSFPLEISGVGLMAGTTVQVGPAVLQPVSVAADKIVVTIPAGMITQAGSLSVSVLRPGDSPSNSLTLTVSPAPAITALIPASVTAQGGTFTLTVVGSGFLPGAAVRWNAHLLPTVLVSSTQLAAAVPAGLIASPGTALIDVSAGGGRFSNAVTMRIYLYPPPALNSINPAVLPVGAGPVSMALSGAGFQQGCLGAFTTPSGTRVPIVPDSCSPTQVMVTLPAGVLGNSGSGQIQVTNPDGQSSAFMKVTLGPPPFTGASLTSAPLVLSGQDQPLTLALEAAYPIDLHGSLTLAFTGDGDLPDDPAIQFQNGSRLFEFSIPAGTQPQVQVTMKSGTLAGLITISPAFTAFGQDVTPAGVVPLQIRIAPAEPSISLFTCTTTSAGIVAVVEGFTNTRAATQAAFDLRNDSGSLGAAGLGAGAPALFGAWFGSPQAAATGGLFRYALPLTTQATTQTTAPTDAGKITSVTVNLSNAIGTSATASCQVQ